MPNPAAIRDRLPLVVTTKEWRCCGPEGITILEVQGESQWALCGKCNWCGGKIIITKRFIAKEKTNDTR